MTGNPISGAWLPAKLRRNEARALSVAFAVLAAILFVTAANALFGIGGAAVVKPIRDWLSSAVYILVAAIVALRAIRVQTHRRPWILFALGLSLYGLGNVLWSLWIGNLTNAPIPSVCDALWLTLYPLSYAGIVGMARVHGQRRMPAGVWLDGIIAGAGLAAVGAALVFQPILSSATGSTVAVGTELAYPIGDLLLAALVLGVLALRGWRVNRIWGLLGGGFLLLALADCMYGVQVAGGSSSPSSMTNLCYVVAVAFLGLAAWQPEGDRPRPRLEATSVLLVPAGFTLTAFGLLVYDHFQALDSFAFALATLTLLAALLRIVLAFRDLQSLAEARHQAATDDLTSLPNRRLFMQRVRDAIAAAAIADGEVSVLMLDLDNFKELNDTLGHNAGDALLRLIGPRLKEALRSRDTVARLGGDEFAVLLDPSPDEAGIVRVAERVLAALRQPFDVEGLALRLTTSMGIASYPAHADDDHGLLKRADVAMYQAKVSRSGFEFYASERDTHSVEKLSIAAELATAIEQNGLELHFQPKAEARSRRIAGVEALVRLRLANGRLVPPLDFLAAAEHAGMSRTVTRTVIELGLTQLVAWRRAGHDLDIAINTTVADLLDADFPREVAAALEAHGLPPDALVLEVTESSVLSDPGRIGNILAQLGELGIRLSLDDFGTGYSSLAHLKSYPVGEVKVDRSFVSRMCTDMTDAAIVYATIELAHKLGIRVVAEGVEDEETWQALAGLGCELVQGYVLSRPLPADELEQVLNAQPARPAGEPSRTTIGA
ncbi:MAG TPA: bifunctional diguanylate cyclase/phosphodiesterase [Solirubrobacteraceae bacterium]|nr:bifunctional diguanylate cyclase/phosphodiesterase [Solirubrobacteraceae bacterium]